MIESHKMIRHRVRQRWIVAASSVVFVGVGLAGCGGSKTTENTLVYGLEAETDAGWCLSEGQLALSGMQIAKAIYDPLTMPDDEGIFRPWLAKSVEPNTDYTKWTIELREGVEFHDGTALTAEVVKNNIDSYRGQYKGRPPSLGLLTFVYNNIGTTTVTGPLTLEVTTLTPWPSFPAYLNANNRFGIMAQAQLDSVDHCDDRMIGTGPFVFTDSIERDGEWSINDHLTVTKNENYWYTGYPLVDAITFKPYPDGGQRLNAVQAGEADLVHYSGDDMALKLEADQEALGLNVYQTLRHTEVAYVMMNNSKLPFSNKNARLALAYGASRDEINKIINLGKGEIANSPFAPGELGHLPDSGWPEYDPEKAKEYIKKYEEETGKKLRFNMLSTTDPGVVALAQLLKQIAERSGIEVNLQSVEQAKLIDAAIGGNFEATVFRLHPGGDPDGQYVWWSAGPVNFARFSDPEMQKLLDQGRLEPDRAKRKEIYEAVSRRFASEVYNIWAWYSRWAIISTDKVHGVLGPPPPGEDGKPDDSLPVWTGLATGHNLIGLCIENVSCPPEALKEGTP